MIFQDGSIPWREVQLSISIVLLCLCFYLKGRADGIAKTLKNRKEFDAIYAESKALLAAIREQCGLPPKSGS